jgi:hypothetical protein
MSAVMGLLDGKGQVRLVEILPTDRFQFPARLQRRVDFLRPIDERPYLWRRLTKVYLNRIRAKHRILAAIAYLQIR